MGRDEQNAALIGSIRAKYPELLDAQLDRLVKDLTLMMSNFEMLLVTANVLNQQKTVISQLNQRMGAIEKREGAIQWGTTAAMAYNSSLAGALGSWAAGTLAANVIHGDVQAGKDALSAPIAFHDALHSQFIDIFKMFDESMEEWFSTIDLAESVAQTITLEAEKCGISLYKDAALEYDCSLAILQENVSKRSLEHKNALEDSAVRCNNAAIEAIKKSTHDANIAAAAGAAAVAAITSALEADHRAEKKEKKEEKPRKSLDDFYA